ncbi:MAG: hypothetical protein ACRENG_08155, partial [bacterium]
MTDISFVEYTNILPHNLNEKICCNNILFLYVLRRIVLLKTNIQKGENVQKSARSATRFCTASNKVLHSRADST